MINKCPFCNTGKKTIGDIKQHISDQHQWKDHWAKWVIDEKM